MKVVQVQQPDGTAIQATHTCELDIDHLPDKVKKAHVFPMCKANHYYLYFFVTTDTSCI